MERHAPQVLLTVEAAAKRLSISRTRMYALIKTRDIRSVRIGRLRRDLGGGKPLDARRLAKALGRYSVRVTSFKCQDGQDIGKTVKGYVTYPTKNQVGLADAWDRYLPAAPDSESEEEGQA